MEQQVKDNVLRVLNKVITAIKINDIKTLKELSNETVHDASIFQDRHSISVAVLIYSLSKIYERETHYAQFKGWNFFCVDCAKGLEEAINKLKMNDEDGFDEALGRYIKLLGKMDDKLRQYIKDVFDSAKINKASRLYEHGLSIGRTAELFGVSRFELMSYVGSTYIADVEHNITLSAKDRLKIARSLF